MDVAAWYRYFAQVEAKGSSPSYQLLANGVAGDERILGWLDALPPAKRQPNLLFASVQYLDGPTVDWEKFRGFVSDRWDDLAVLMSERSTQTNEVARCSALVPVLGTISSPVALIEVGASAGLCLSPDRYAYVYGDSALGDSVLGDSALRLDVGCTGPVPVPTEMPDIRWRRGVDLHPLDVTASADVDWLDACIWPEHVERRDRLARAVRIAAAHPPVIVAGDLNDEIENLLAAAPADAVTVVFHSAVLSYLSEDDRLEFGLIMDRHPDVVWISNEAPGVVHGVVPPEPPPSANAFVLGRNGTEALAYTDPHGSWLHWFPTS